MHKNDKGEIVWSDPQSQEVHGRIQALVTQQQSEENENPMTGDDILANVLGERTGYVCGKGHRKRPPRKNRLQPADVEASVSSAMTNIRQQIQVEMQAKMDQKLQEIREKLRDEMDGRFQEQMTIEVYKRIQEQMAVIMSKMQQGQGS
ncbi:uncharacterized protein LOC132040657 [Lycium ferocissimum]|uniref:uncharacterized protein LOC132040657 n=1 Tax=Lycium ferocissimum TaxID=112874 RepID=UPI00281583E4|nr:uncharacterized protein LOC132040657 [Lycium ferocissimum]